jgi:hypothetical protein
LGRVAAFAVFASAVIAQTAGIPKIEDFPATEKFSGKPAAPAIKTAGDRTFRTKIHEGAARGPNFAGHLTIATWGCGSSCLDLAVIDARTGEIYPGLPAIFSFGAPLKFPDGAETTGDKFEPLSFRLNSRLLILRGCPDEKDCALYAFEWTGKTFRLLTQQPASPLR